MSEDLSPDDQPHPRSAHTWIKEVYDKLRRLARAKILSLKPGQTLQPTALVHEAWLKLAQNPDATWQNRAHFFATAAEAMRQVLVDQARRKQAGKRGSGATREELDESNLSSPVPDDELLEVHESVDALARHDAQAAQVVKLRYFVGLTLEETADNLDISPRTAGNLWEYGRAWLQREIERQRER